MLNSGAPGVMLDLEDSMANAWEHLMLGHGNIVAALYGDLYVPRFQARRDGAHRAERDGRVEPGARPPPFAGRHFRGETTSASLFDLALLAFTVDSARLKHPLCIYIPKSESADEALWWKDVFDALLIAKDGRPDRFARWRSSSRIRSRTRWKSSSSTCATISSV